MSGILRPATAREAAEELKDLAGSGRPLRFRGGGTLWGLAPAYEGEVDVLESLGMDRLLDYQAQDLTVEAEAGITIAKLDAVLAEKGQRFPFDVPCPDKATLGGALASGLAGPRRLASGLPRDWILGLEAALTDGSLVHGGGRVVKNVAGYDVQRLFVGSRGGLGFITKAVLRTSPRPEISRWYSAALPDLKRAWERTQALASSGLRPAACELSSDPARLEILLEGSPALVKEGEEKLAGLHFDRLEDGEGKARGERLRDMIATQPRSIHLRLSVSPARARDLLDSALSRLQALSSKLSFRAHALSGVMDLFLDEAMEGQRAGLAKALVQLSELAAQPRSGGYSDGFALLVKAPSWLRGSWAPYQASPLLENILNRVKASVDPSGLLNRPRAA